MRKQIELSLNVGKRIMQIQNIRPDITDQEIADCIGKSVSMVRDYKKGNNMMSLSSCVDLVEKFQIDPRFLILGDTTVPVFMEDDEFYLLSETEKCRMHVNSLVEVIRKLPPNKQVECLSILMTEVGKGIEL